MNIIVVFPKKEIASKINGILIQNGFNVVAVCASGAKALQALQRLETGVIISGIRFKDMTYMELKMNLPSETPMIVVASQNQWEEYGEDDVIFLPVPFKAYDLVEIVQDISWEYDHRMRKKGSKRKAIRSEREQGMILKAKERLMRRNGWCEEEAHHYLQKNSMDTGRSLVDTAILVLEMF